MADNTTLDAGAGGDTIATDDIGGVKHQRIKIQYGADGSATDVSDSNPLPVDDAGGSLTVDDGGGALTVDGTVTANLAAGTNNIGDVDVLTEPATAADGATGLPAVTKVVAGFDGTDVQALTTDSSGILQVDVASAIPAGNNNIGDVDVASSVLPTGASTSANQTTIIGHLDGVEGHLDGVEALLTTIDADTSALAGTVSGAELQVDVVSIPSHAVTNAGTFAVQDSEKLADDAAFTVGTTKVQPVGYLADQASTDSVNEGDVGAARMTLDRKQIVTVAPSNDTEGWDVFRSIDLDETEEEAKATAGKVGGWFIFNAHSATLYVKLYNATAANVTVGTTTPRMTIPIPAGSAANAEFTAGISFDTAITAACTTGVADNDTGAPGANLLQIDLLYK